MANKIGTIAYCGYKNIQTKRGNSQIWSFKLEEDGEFYSCNFTKPQRPDGIKLLAGDKVKFSFEDNQYGHQVDMDSLQVKPIAKPSDDKPKRTFGGSKSSGGGSRDDYWAKKEKFDKETTQPLIMRQSANNIAANLVVAALEKDVLPLPSKKADKYEAYMLCFKQVRDELTQELMNDYIKLGGPDVTELLGLGNVEEEEEGFDRSGEDLAQMNVGTEEAKDMGWEDMEDDGWENE